MTFRSISYKHRGLTIHKAAITPKFNDKTVLVTDTWDYIDLWLTRQKARQARFFWKQAKSFYQATTLLPKESAPLTGYYSMLNATKALLNVKDLKFEEYHGVGGDIGANETFGNETVTFRSGGVLAALAAYLGEGTTEQTYSLTDLLYNLAYIHRAYHLTVPSRQELFIPIVNPQIVRSNTTDKAWFRCELRGHYASEHTVNKLANSFERDCGDLNGFFVRSKKRFDWTPTAKAASIERYQTYHCRLRKRLVYIHGSQRLWYLKRSAGPSGYVERSQLSVAFAIMHKLSELARYSPDRLAKYFNGRYNWLLSEFISVAPSQFIDNISSEMTGLEFMPPWRRNG